MSQFDDIMICEGVNEPPGETEDERRDATLASWQRIIDSGVVWELQGWFGRNAANLIRLGLCTAASDTSDDNITAPEPPCT